MKRLFSLFYTLPFLLVATGSYAQKKGDVSPENIYRPVYGYILDTLTNQPVPNVVVYGFDSVDDALKGKETLAASGNPMKLKLKGDVVETFTDASGRYMLPMLKKGALVFYLKDRKEAVLREVNGRSSVNYGKKEAKRDFEIDLSAYSSGNYQRMRRNGPAGVHLDMDFNCYLSHHGEDRKNSRLVIERRLVDVASGRILESSVPVVRDGRTYHRLRKKMIAKGLIQDSLYRLAERFPVLSDTTYNVRVKDNVDTEKWKDQRFRLGYFVTLHTEAGPVPVDTLYMMTNRVSKPFEYLQYHFAPFAMEEPAETSVQRRSVNRRLVLQGEYDGAFPETLRDSSYVLAELHLKAVVAPERTYRENMIVADTLVQRAMREHRALIAEKIDSTVRIIKTSEVVRWVDIADMLSEQDNIKTADEIRKIVKRNSGSVDDQTAAIAAMDDYLDVVVPCLENIEKVEYKYIFTTGRQFSKSEWLRAFRRAKDDERLERLCVRAIEESRILEKEPWDYASNLLASIHIRKGKSDTTILAPLVKPESASKELVANQTIMLMLAGEFGEACKLSASLPDICRYIAEIARCMSGLTPADDEALRLIEMSSPRNKVVADMYSGKVGDQTLAALNELPDSDALTWLLRARYHCVRCGGDLSVMKSEKVAYSGKTIYDEVVRCLKESFALDNSLVQVAVLDAGIDEYALKEALGVYVL